MVASVVLPGAHATPVQAAAVGSNMRKFVARQGAKQKEKKEKKKKAEEEKKSAE
jgi:hypothetical protein